MLELAGRREISIMKFRCVRLVLCSVLLAAGMGSAVAGQANPIASRRPPPRPNGVVEVVAPPEAVLISKDPDTREARQLFQRMSGLLVRQFIDYPSGCGCEWRSEPVALQIVDTQIHISFRPGMANVRCIYLFDHSYEDSSRWTVPLPFCGPDSAHRWVTYDTPGVDLSFGPVDVQSVKRGGGRVREWESKRIADVRYVMEYEVGTTLCVPWSAVVDHLFAESLGLAVVSPGEGIVYANVSIAPGSHGRDGFIYRTDRYAGLGAEDIYLQLDLLSDADKGPWSKERNRSVDSGRSRLTGILLDEEGWPAAYASVMLPALRRGMMTGNDGKFYLLQLEPGIHEVRITRNGHDPISRRIPLLPGRTTEIRARF